MELLNKEQFLKQIFDYEQKSEWEYQGDVPCLIDFHDDTCPPCQSVAPVLNELAEQYSGRVKFFKVDTPTENVLMKELGVINLPTILLCPVDGKPVVYQGAASKEKITTAIEKELLAERNR
jgi:thioredoxin-like negative regulator of GroEL